MEDENDFFEKYDYLNSLCNYKIRKLEKKDYKHYLDIMFEFTNYKYDITIETFNNEMDEMEKLGLKEIIILEHMNKIIGVGTIFKLKKLHNNPIGQIEDVIITEKYRKLGLGKIIIRELVNIGLNNMKCYKIILNCLDKNVDFYKKCGFEQVGSEMKYVFK
jgi:glucosamine-phosphate N-acetyltransferase